MHEELTTCSLGRGKKKKKTRASGRRSHPHHICHGKRRDWEVQDPPPLGHDQHERLPPSPGDQEGDKRVKCIRQMDKARLTGLESRTATRLRRQSVPAVAALSISWEEGMAEHYALWPRLAQRDSGRRAGLVKGGTSTQRRPRAKRVGGRGREIYSRQAAPTTIDQDTQDHGIGTLPPRVSNPNGKEKREQGGPMPVTLDSGRSSTMEDGSVD